MREKTQEAPFPVFFQISDKNAIWKRVSTVELIDRFHIFFWIPRERNYQWDTFLKSSVQGHYNDDYPKHVDSFVVEYHPT